MSLGFVQVLLSRLELKRLVGDLFLEGLDLALKNGLMLRLELLDGGLMCTAQLLDGGLGLSAKLLEILTVGLASLVLATFHRQYISMMGPQRRS